MKRTTALFAAFFAASACGLRAQSAAETGDSSDRSEKIRYQLILPEEKAPEVVKPSEPNPFSKADTHVIKEDGASGEENRVREVLSNLSISGYVDGPDGPRVLLGPMKLKRGDMVPKVLAEQSVNVRVNAISPTQMDLVWVEKKKSVTGLAPRMFTLPIHVVKPKVRIELPTLPPPPVNGKGSNIIYQSDPSLLSSSGSGDTPPETRKAVAAENAKPASGASDPPAVVKAGEEAPASTLMNMLFKSMTNKTVDGPPPAAPAAK